MIDLQIDATAQREDADFYFNESRDMVTVIRKMLEAGECLHYYYYFCSFFCCCCSNAEKKQPHSDITPNTWNFGGKEEAN